MSKIETEQLMQFITGKWMSKPVFIVSKLGIADILSTGRKSITELARKTSSNEDYLYRIMRALSSFGIFREIHNRSFEQTHMSELLMEEAMGTFAILFNDRWNDKAWENLPDSLKTGDIPFERTYNMSLVDYLKEDQYAFKIHNQANAIKSSRTHRAIVDCYDFSQFKTITDVGGGTGALLSEILFENSGLKGVLAEQPEVIDAAQPFLEKLRFKERVETIPCDFFKKIPEGSCAYILSHILHDWDDKRCETILTNLGYAMERESKLLICEMIIPEPNTPSVATLLDLEMLVMTGGRERTIDEYEKILKKTGFVISDIIDTAQGVSLIEVKI